jgi:hypothetical protein
MTKRMLSALFLTAAVAGAVGLAWVTAVPAAGPKVKTDFSTAPAVYGGGAIFAYSGLDGEPTYAMPVVGRTLADGLGIRFDLPKEPTIRIRLPEPGMSALKFLMVTGDTIVASVPWDPELLIITFASPNVVTGRLPLSLNVVLEGGDANVLLLKKLVDGRMTFGFCYDTRPAPPAPAPRAADPSLMVTYMSSKLAPLTKDPPLPPLMVGANLGLAASAESFVDDHLAYFKALPPVPKDADRASARALAKAFSVLRVNEYAPEGPIKFRWSTPSRAPQRDLYAYGSALHSLGLMHVDPKLAKEALMAVYAFQAETGAIPARVSPAGQPGQVSHPPILGWAAWQVFNKDGARDKVFLEKSFDVVQKHVTWFMKKRRLDGEPPPTQSLESGTPLYFWQSAEEAGQEGSPRFEGTGAFAAIDLSCYLANECWTLQAMAQRLGYGELAKTWGGRAEAIAAAARRELWDGQRGFFFDRKGPDGQWLPVWSTAGFLPLWSGVATPDQAAGLKNQLLSKKFWTPLPLPAIAHDDAAFKKEFRRGPVWMDVNYMVIRGLQRYGYAREATELRDKTLGAVTAWYAKTGTLWEFYDCDDQTSPRELPRTGGAGGAATAISDANATAALFIDLVIRAKP